MIVEVLSPSTRGYDRGEKFEKYQMIPSFREYLLVAPDRVRVEHYRLPGPQQWVLEIQTNLQDKRDLSSVPVEPALADLYEDLSFA